MIVRLSDFVIIAGVSQGLSRRVERSFVEIGHKITSISMRLSLMYG